MNKIHLRLPDGIKRTIYVTAAVVVSTASVFSGMINKASALQVTTRFIKMSNSTNGATNVAYHVGFTTSTTSVVQGIVIDFCSNDPIIGDPCTAPTGFNVNRNTTAILNQTNITGFSVYTSDATNNRIILTNSSGGSISLNTNVSFDLGNGTTNGITNPNPANPGTFYARIYTYNTDTAAQGHNTANPTGYVDYGGVALSTAAVINITAKVQETLSFCVYLTACGDTPSITLGHQPPGSTAVVIDSTAVDTADVNFSVSTNAQNGARIRMKGDTLKSGANFIHPGGTGSPIVAANFPNGAENFGFRVSTAGTNISAVAPYNGASGSYALDTVAVDADQTANVKGEFGGLFANLSGPVNGSVSTLTFAAGASNTTTAGTYTAAEQLIATGTF